MMLCFLCFSTGSIAQYKVDIVNDNGRVFSNTDSLEVISSWIERQISKKSWGKNELELPSSEVVDKTKCKELKDVMQEDSDGNIKTVEYCVTKPTYKICGKYYYELDIAKDCEGISQEIADKVKAEKDKADKKALLKTKDYFKKKSSETVDEWRTRIADILEFMAQEL